MTRFRLDRRTMLKGLLGGAVVGIGLPPLDVFFDGSGVAYAQCGSLPRRMGWWFYGNGAIPAQWTPRGEGAAFTLPPETAPLEPLRSKLAFVTGTRVLTPNTSPHGSGPAGLLAGGDKVGSSYPGPTIDQIVADAVGSQTRFRSLELGVQRSTNGLSHSAPDATNPPEPSPMALFERLFGAGFRAPGETSEPDPRLALRRSVLDVVTGQARRLQARLGARDRQRLEAHLEGIRAIEMQIARLEADPPSLAACMRPPMPDGGEYPDLEGRPQMRAISNVMSDLLAMALACDQTRVFSVMYSQPVNDVLFEGAPAGHHQLTHDEPGEQPEVHRIVVSIHEDMAYFLSALDRIEEGDGTLLDHSGVLCTTDVSFGRTHSIEDMPLVIAGSMCGALRTGLHYRSAAGENACKVSLTLLRAMGLPVAEFGFGPGRTTDGLGAIEA